MVGIPKAGDRLALSLRQDAWKKSFPSLMVTLTAQNQGSLFSGSYTANVENSKNSVLTLPPPPNLIYRRFKAALDLQGLGVEQVARLAGVSSRHVWFALRNQRRPSHAVLAHIRSALGEPGWLFATGQTDTLRDDSTAGEVANHAAS